MRKKKRGGGGGGEGGGEGEKKKMRGELNHQISAWKHYALSFHHNYSGFFCITILDYFFPTRGATFRKKNSAEKISQNAHIMPKQIGGHLTKTLGGVRSQMDRKTAI